MGRGGGGGLDSGVRSPLPLTAVLTSVVACAVALAACEPDAPASAEAAGPALAPAAEAPDGDEPDTPFDASDMVFEPSEPPEVVVQIPPRPPAPPPLPTPDLTPPPLPAPRAQAGSCDVRESEGYCFAYTGDAWGPADARAQCTAAPNARFADAACPLADRVATCTFERPSAPGKEITYTYYAPYELALAELACPGVFERVD